MERSAIRVGSIQLQDRSPDFAALHPGHNEDTYSVVREQGSKRLSESLFFGFGGI